MGDSKKHLKKQWEQSRDMLIVDGKKHQESVLYDPPNIGTLIHPSLKVRSWKMLVTENYFPFETRILFRGNRLNFGKVTL